MFSDTPEGFRSGFVSFVGRPNTGKSTLTNALVGQKIAITADQPETTRHPIRGHRAPRGCAGDRGGHPRLAPSPHAAG